jgi:uncharacterized integral membrane protein (TIGR00698 family)
MAMAAVLVSNLYGGPPFLYALFVGVAFHYLSHDIKTQPGVEFCSRAVLRLGVGLLGARITADQIAGLGWATAAIVVAAVLSTMLCGVVLGRVLGLSRSQSVLSGGAVAICGASAALAISAVLPRDKESERFTLMVVVTVTVLSTIAMVLYPLMARLLNLPPDMAGLFLGGSIHDVAQVVGAGYTMGPQVGDHATIVKLFRVSMLAVVVLVVSALFKRQRESSVGEPAKARQPLVPWFLWMFVALVILNSMGAVSPAVASELNDISRACLVIAIAALGMKTSFGELTRTGWQPLLLLVIETFWMAGFVLCTMLFLA